MSMRETLRKAARELFNASQSANPLYTEKMCGLSAFLDELARRMDAAAAHERENAGVNEYHAGASDMLARLDASPPAAPGEPGATCGTCGGCGLVPRPAGDVIEWLPCPAHRPSPPRSPEAKK